MNLPPKFEARMRKMLETEYEDFFKAISPTETETEPPLFSGIRINTLKENAKTVILGKIGNMENVPWCRDGFYADKSVISGNHPYHLAGLFYFQEPSAMSTVSALPIEKDDYVLDLCAAPGGKATHAGAILNGSGLLVANEIVRGRASILSDNIERMGIRNAVVTNETPQRLAEKYPCFFDKIIVDAPCSGEGMFRKEPQAIDEWSEEHTVSCGERQKKILDSAMRMLRGGGYLVYSTCTFAPAENEEVCAYMLDNYNVELVPLQGLDMLCEGKTEWSGSDFDMSFTRRIFPHKQKGEGHFVALFHSLDDDRAVRKSYPMQKCDGEKLYRDFENRYLTVKLDGEFYQFGENLYLLPRGIDIDKIKVLRAGLHLGICRKGRFEPSHALCLALCREDFKSSVDFDSESKMLKTYLMGGTIDCTENGWCAVTADGYPIGWGKASGGVLKNHFPKYLRLKK